jgi:septum formation protein
MPQTTDPIILASSSPRRAQLLETIGVNFVIAPSHFVERPYLDEQPTNYIMRVARAKAVEVARTRDSGLVIGADTIVVVDGKMLGKPADETEAGQMLRMLSGRWHAVMTGVSLYEAGSSRREVADYDKTLVRFAKLSDAEIDWYVATGECNDKAGAYAIQEKGGLFVEEIAGNYHNVVGLPLPLLYRLARQLGYSLI